VDHLILVTACHGYITFLKLKQGKQGNHLEIIWCMFHFATSWYHCNHRALFKIFSLHLQQVRVGQILILAMEEQRWD